MREVESAPGLRFVYSAEWPSICILVRDGVAVTVVTRGMMQRSHRVERDSARGRSGRPRIHDRWRWDGDGRVAEVAA